MYYMDATDHFTRLIHRGDVVAYDKAHISTVYSKGASDCTISNSSTNCNYQIVHANGNSGYKDKAKVDHFTRKVIIMPNQISDGKGKKQMPEPTGFGRIKLWD